MPELQHPRNAEGKGCLSRVGLGGRERYPVEDGYIQVPEDAVDRVRSWAEQAYGVEYDGLEIASEELEEMDHDQLKHLTEEAGLDDEIDLRSRENMIEALNDGE